MNIAPVIPQLRILPTIAALENWEEIERWAYFNSALFNACQAKAREIGLARDDTLKLALWTLLKRVQDTEAQTLENALKQTPAYFPTSPPSQPSGKGESEGEESKP